MDVCACVFVNTMLLFALRLDCFVVMLKFMNDLSFHYLSAGTPENAKVGSVNKDTAVTQSLCVEWSTVFVIVHTQQVFVLTHSVHIGHSLPPLRKSFLGRTIVSVIA